jgi:hypothetical protein
MKGPSQSSSEPGRCNACGRVFTREGNLTKHMRDHCNSVRRRAKKQWRHAAVNLTKLHRTGNLQKRPVVGSRPLSVSGENYGQAKSADSDIVVAGLSNLVRSLFLEKIQDS